MQHFKHFYTEQQWYGGSKSKFEPGEIVLVSSKTQIGSTNLNKVARPYVNQIGTVIKKIPRSMASPYFVVQFDDKQQVPIISLFLRGPYKSKRIAQKYQADPTLTDNPTDVLYVNEPKLAKILSKYGRNYVIENEIKKHLPGLQWLNENEIQSREGPHGSSDFLIASQSFDIKNNDIIEIAKQRGLTIVDNQLVIDLYRRNLSNKKLEQYILEYPEYHDIVNFTIDNNVLKTINGDYNSGGYDIEVYNLSDYIKFPFFGTTTSHIYSYNSMSLSGALLHIQILNNFIDYVISTPPSLKKYIHFYLRDDKVKRFFDYEGYGRNIDREFYIRKGVVSLLGDEEISDEDMVELL